MQATGRGGDATGLGGPSTGAAYAPTPEAPSGEQPGPEGSAAGSNTDGSAATGGDQPMSGSTLPSVRPQTGGSVLPAGSGRGFDAGHVYIGVTTSKDTKAAADAAGYKGIDPGDVEGDVAALLKEVNRRGGLFGRQVVARFHDESEATITSNPAQAAQQTCTSLTQDNPVALVINTLPGIDGSVLYQCLAKAKTPFLTMAPRLTDGAFQRQYAPYFHATIQLDWDRLSPVLLNRLLARRYFAAWDTTAGAPGKAPVRIGLLYGSAPVNSRVFERLATQLKKRGFAAPTTFTYDMSTAANAFASVGGAVLRFKSAGVTHVIVDEAVLSIFATAAEQQHYRPRYAMQTIMAPAGAKAAMPAGQLTGTLGVGWSAAADVETQPPLTSPQRACNALLKTRGLDYTGNPTAQAVAYGLCDAIPLGVDAFRLAGALTAPAFASGFAKARREVTPASTFTSDSDDASPVLAGGVRDFGYVASCTCLTYLSSTTYRL